MNGTSNQNMETHEHSVTWSIKNYVTQVETWAQVIETNLTQPNLT